MSKKKKKKERNLQSVKDILGRGLEYKKKIKINPQTFASSCVKENVQMMPAVGNYELFELTSSSL